MYTRKHQAHSDHFVTITWLNLKETMLSISRQPYSIAPSDCWSTIVNCKRTLWKLFGEYTSKWDGSNGWSICLIRIASVQTVSVGKLLAKRLSPLGSFRVEGTGKCVDQVQLDNSKRLNAEIKEHRPCIISCSFSQRPVLSVCFTDRIVRGQ